MQNLRDLSVLILGLGASGLAMARWCHRHGARVTVADTREAPPQLPALLEECPGVVFLAGALHAGLVQGQDIRAVFASPGLSPASTAPVMDAARSIGLWVGGELDLFAQALADLSAQRGYQPKVLAITGTNGKTTTTALTAQLVARAGRSVALAGNIGPTLLDTLWEHLQIEAAPVEGESPDKPEQAAEPTLPEVWVLELSSFQLHGVRGFEPTAATVLNLTQDHLDWHGDMAAYGAAKARIFGSSGLVLLNRDDPAVMAMQPKPAAKGQPQQPVVTFGAQAPQRPGDWGIAALNGMAWLVRAHEADETRRARRASSPARAEHEEEAITLQPLMPAEALRIRGRHNATNALAALALAHSAGCAIGPMLHGLREYRGEPHRVEPVGIVNGVEYVDDSKGTNVGATVAALHGLGAERRLVLILGGDGKGQDFQPLAEPVARFARAVVLIGRDAALLAQALASTGVPLQQADSLQQAVQLASAAAQMGDAVLLSPACASLDMFRDYAHRAEVFRAEVHGLAEAAGQSLEGAA